MNKLRPGDQIELKSRSVRHHVKSIGLYYVKPESGTFVTQYASEVSMFLGSYLKKCRNPIGKVIGYGARIDGPDNHKWLMVRVSNKFGRSEVLSIEEKDVTLLKRKK